MPAVPSIGLILSLDQTRDISARDRDCYRELLLPFSEISQIPAVECPEPFDTVGEVAAVGGIALILFRRTVLLENHTLEQQPARC